jgi:hypothetical protein
MTYPREFIRKETETEGHIARPSLDMLRLVPTGSCPPFPSHSPDFTPPDGYLWELTNWKIFREPIPTKSTVSMGKQYMNYTE